MPVHKRVPATALPKTPKSGTHAVGSRPRPPRPDPPTDPRAEPLLGPDPRAEPPNPLPPPRHGLSALLKQLPSPASRDSVGASPEIEIESTEIAECEPELKVQATVDALCDGCGTVVEVELSRFLESSAVACTDCLNAVVKGWGKALDRPTIEWIPSSALLCASRPPMEKPSSDAPAAVDAHLTAEQQRKPVE